jgi:energy-coupling factor transporter transmembrane protein EcfT
LAFIKPKKSQKLEKTEQLNNQYEKILKKRFKKINDPNYSLFDEQYKSTKFMNKAFWIFLAVGFVFLIPGIILLVRGNIAAGVPLTTFGALGIMMLIYLPILIFTNRTQKPILELRENKAESKLLEYAQKYSSSNAPIEQEQAKLATYALIDLKSPEIAKILQTRIINGRRAERRQLLTAFYLLAKKMGYADH